VGKNGGRKNRVTKQVGVLNLNTQNRGDLPFRVESRNLSTLFSAMHLLQNTQFILCWMVKCIWYQPDSVIGADPAPRPAAKITGWNHGFNEKRVNTFLMKAC
jgi:hypothetical protein